MAARHHHRVYVVLLRNPRGDGRDGYYVGMTGLPLEDRFANHKRGYKSASVVRKYGVRFAWELFDGIPAMSFKEAALTEPTLADDLRDLGYLVYGAAVLELGRDAGVELAEQWVLTPLGLAAIAGLVGLAFALARRRV